MNFCTSAFAKHWTCLQLHIPNQHFLRFRTLVLFKNSEPSLTLISSLFLDISYLELQKWYITNPLKFTDFKVITIVCKSAGLFSALYAKLRWFFMGLCILSQLMGWLGANMNSGRHDSLGLPFLTSCVISLCLGFLIWLQGGKWHNKNWISEI